MPFTREKVITKLPIIDIKQDTIIFEEGWDDYKMFFILEGRVQLFNRLENGAEIEAAIIQKHQFFGELEMYLHKSRNTCARIITPSKLLVIRTPAQLEHFVSNNLWLTDKLVLTMSERLAVANDLLVRKRTSELKPIFDEPVLETTQDNTIRRVVRY